MTQTTTEHEDMQTNFTRLDVRVSGLETALTSLVSEVKSLASTFNTSQRTNWPLLITAGGMFCTLAVGVWYVIDLKSQTALMPVLIQNAISTKEREENRNNLSKIEDILVREVSSRSSGFAALQQQTVEAETQHRMRDAVSNIQYDNLMSHIRQLYVLTKTPPPDSPSYHPSIGREINTPIPNN